MKQGEVGALVLVVLLLGILWISGCGGGGFDPAPVPRISPSSAILSPGQSLQFTAIADGLPLANSVWLVNGVAGGTPTTGTITNQGLYTAPTGSVSVVKPEVSVRDSADGAQSAPALISIFQPEHFDPGTV